MIRFSCALLMAMVPTGASAQLKPSAPEAVAEAVVDCWASVEAKAVSRIALAARGWQPGSFRGPKGGKAEADLLVYGKSNSDVLIIVASTGNSSICSVTSRVSRVEEADSIAQAIQRRLTAFDPQVKTARSGNSIVFIALPKLATIDATGTKSKPAVRISVGYQGAERG